MAMTASDAPPASVNDDPGRSRFVFLLCATWSLFQLWIASPLPFALGTGIVDDGAARAIHLAFGLSIAFLMAAGRSSSAMTRRGLAAAAALGAAAALYLVVFDDGLAARAGEPTMADLWVGGLGLVFLLEATRRVLGPALVTVAGVFLAYAAAGPLLPDLLAHKGASLVKLVSHQWLTSEGVFGIALGVSTSVVFMFVLFGTLLERAGAGAYFIRLSFAVLGAARGGPAKAAVLASGLTGIVSGSSIANVVTTGTFTIPLMKRVGFKPEKAGAVEVSASVNGQIMPPVMGAAAFLMVDYVGISYADVMRHALLPAVMSYAALFYIVHLEALRAGISGLPRLEPVRPLRVLAGAVFGFFALVILAAIVHYGFGWLKPHLGPWSPAVVAGVLAATYAGLMAVSHRSATTGPAGDDFTVVPPLYETLRGGIHYVLPLALLLWLLVVERFSPGLAAAYASFFLLAMIVFDRPMAAWFQGRALDAGQIGRGFRAAYAALAGGGEGMVAVALATATAGIIVGVVSLTGVGLAMTEIVETVSGGNLFLILGLTAMISLILGLGLPTTAAYIVVATLMAPVIVALGAEQGLVVPLIAAHLFVFYFALLADVTPPVGLATYAAAALAGADPLETGLASFLYSLRTAVLPFAFIFNAELLLIGIGSAGHVALTAAAALAGALIFSAATMGILFTRNRLVETAALLLIAFTLFRPDFWMDRVAAPYARAKPAEIINVASSTPAGGHIRFLAAGETVSGRRVDRTITIRLSGAPEQGAGKARLKDAGLAVWNDAGVWRVEQVDFGSRAQKAGLETGWRIEGVLVPSGRPAKEWAFVPAMLAFFWVARRQRKRLALGIAA